MSQLFLDTSAIVKRYMQETGSNWVKNLLNPVNGNLLIISDIAMPEFAAAIASKRRAGTITPVEQTNGLALFLQDCNVGYQLVSVSREIINRAVSLTQNYRLRGYDAVQLATALVSKHTLNTTNIPLNFILISADQDLLNAAQSEGLATDNPNFYP